MFAHALPTGSLRPAEALPPTLVPNAVLAMAPPAPRRLSLLGACLVYAGCGLAFTLAPSMNLVPDLHPRTTPSSVLQDPTQFPVVQLKPEAPPPPPARNLGFASKQGPEREETWRPPTEQLEVPATPDHFPTQDRSGDSLRYAPAEVGVQPPPGAAHATGTGEGESYGGVVEIDYRQMLLVSKVDPAYPAMARHARIQGSVVLVMTVDDRGVPVEVKSLGGPHPSLEQEAMRAARLWRFQAAQVNGQPVKAQFRLTLNFRLQ